MFDLDDQNVVVETVPFWRKRRYLIVLMGFLGFINVYTLRINLSVAIVAMTEIRTVFNENGTTSTEQDFNWDTKQQGLVLSSFFYGYLLTQFLGGYIASRIGGNLVLGFGIGATAILTLFSPLAAKSGLGVLVGLRVFMGICEGVTLPCMHEIWSKWAPPLERSRMASIVYAGNYVGMVIAMSVCGLLSEYYGWESVFYVFGIIGCIWFVFWMFLVKESPEKDPWISENERKFIQQSLGHNKSTQRENPPWKSIFTSTAVWAIIASHFSENWGLYTLLTQLPKFLKNTLDFDLAKSGFIAAVPYLTLGIVLCIAGYLADWSQTKGYLTTTQVRKYFNCGAFIAQMTFMLLASYQRDRFLIILFLTLGASLGGFSICGYGVNHLDIAPQFASILIGISNTIATIPGVVSPLIAGFIVTDEKNANQWQIIFFITAAVYLFGSIVYWFFVSGELQPWAKTSNKINQNVLEIQ